MPQYRFGPFSLDPEARVLLRNGEPVAMAGKTFDTLLALIQNRGRLMDKDELLAKIWPGTVVEEANLSQNIFTIRKILGDSPKDHRYIATVAGRGYQFVAPVREVNGASPTKPYEPMDAHLFWQRSRVIQLGVVAAAVAVVAAAWSLLHRPNSVPVELVERQLTFNSGATAIESAALSRDGKYLAYSDPAGIHVRLLETGEERMLPMPAGVPASAVSYVDSWFPDGTQLLIDSEQSGRHGSLWIVSPMGQSPRELRADSKGWSISPDGTLIAFNPYAQIGELWLVDSRGESARRIVELPADEWLAFVRWAPDGQRLAYVRKRGNDMSIETCDLRGANRTTVVTVSKANYGLPGICWLSDGRMVYALLEDNGHDGSLWQVTLDTHSGRATGKPRKIAHWTGSSLWDLSASADGKRLALRKVTSRAQAYLGELAGGGKRMSAPRRLSDNEAENSPTAWTPDSKAVLFTSNRNGKWGIYRQEITQDSAEPIVTGLAAVYLPRLSPDGASVVYVETPESLGSAGYRLMRVPVKGGLPHFVFKLRSDGFDFSCSRAPATFCAILEVSQDREHSALTAVDPANGTGKLLRTVRDDFSAEGLSPDGSTFAMAKRGEAETHIRLLSLTGGSDHEIVLKNWPRIVGLDWSADGKGLYCGFTSPQGGTLVYVELNGATHVLWHSSEVGANAFLGGIPSPDGHYLAIWGGVNSKNVWMVEGF